ncbi:MAG: FHA domain-containing protein [Deltaproteobacteria bacterium]|nr:FHA domain-containing protein [Deltaproteobacteria bacterium]
MASIVLTSGYDKGTSFKLNVGRNIIGRSPDSDIRLKDPWISRSHAEIIVSEDGRFYLEDLASVNGTYLNGQKISRSELRHKDSIYFGKTSAIFLVSELADIDEASAQSLLSSKDTTLRNIKDFQREAPQALGEGLGILAEIGKYLIQGYEFEDVISKIVEIVVKTMRADKCLLFMIGEMGDLELKVAKYLDGREVDKHEYSRTIINTALNDRVSILTINAQEDLRFRESRSIIAHSITSAICVPLWLEDRVLGVIYMESNILVRPFKKSDLDLVTVIGYQIALAIEEYRLRLRIQEEEKKRLRLLRHFSPDVSKMLLEEEAINDNPLSPSVKYVTILFADIVNFTSLAERMEPIELADFLNTYFRLTSEAIFQENGTLDKFIGDAVMALFGAPYTRSDDAVRAIKAALRIYRALELYNSNAPEGKKINIRIGINSGNVIAGNFGSMERMEYTVLGDTVNVAARIQAACEPGQILIGHETYKNVQGRFMFRYLGEKILKGKSEAIPIYEVLWKMPRSLEGVIMPGSSQIT